MDTIVGHARACSRCSGCRQAYHKDANADLVVLDDVNLTLREGEIVALLGPLGFRQVDPAAHRRRPAARRPPGEVLWRGEPVQRAGRGRRDGVPELRAVPLADRAGERGAGAGGARRAARPSASSAPRPRST